MEAEAVSGGAGERPLPAALDLGLAFEQAAIGMALVAPDGRFLRVNQALCELLGHQEMELVAGAVDAAASFEDLGGVGERLRRGEQPPPPFEVARRAERADGSVVELLFSVTVLRDRGHRPLGFLAQAQDVTERNQATRALKTNEAWLRSVIANAPIVISFYVHDGPLPAVDGDGDDVAGVISVAVDITDLERAERERRGLLHQLITAQESEQRRLAGNLHDDAIQALSAARIHLSVLDAAMDKLGVDAEGDLRDAAKQIRENLDHGLAAARTFLFDLRPPLLDREGLAPALGQQLDKLGQRKACATEFRWDVDQRLDPDLEVLVFRVVQEALANIARHAGASRVRVHGRLRDGRLEVEVDDDGIGFDEVQARERAMATGHLGLRSMAERLEAAGGELTIDAAPGHGARVRLRLPLPDAAG